MNSARNLLICAFVLASATAVSVAAQTPAPDVPVATSQPQSPPEKATPPTQAVPPVVQPEPKQTPSEFTFKLDQDKSGSGGGTVEGQARKQEFVKDEFAIFEGDVRIKYRDITITADRIRANLKTKDVFAEGHVVLDQGTRRLSGDRIQYNLDSETGVIENAIAFFDIAGSFQGEKVEKIGPETYRLTNGLFTACEIGSPSWSFRIARGTITLNDYARMRNVSFRAKKIPLFWTPYISWPTKPDRSRGFLIPRFGEDSTLGRHVGMSYFLPIGQSYDVTILGDYFSNGYHSFGADLRYRPAEDTNGRVRIQALRDAETGDFEWRQEYQHTQENVFGGFRGVIDIQDFTDIGLFRLYERDFQMSSLSNLYSAAYLSRNRPSYGLNIRADRREHVGTTTSQVFEQLPAVQFQTYPNRLGASPFYFSMESSASHLRTSLGANYYRGDIFPTLSMQLRTAPWISLKPQLSLRETFYTVSRDPETLALTEQDVSRSYAQAQLEMIGPSLSRIYDKSFGGFSKFKHVIEPRARYVYTTDVEEQPLIVPFDTVDSPILPIVRDSVEYSLTQRILGKPSTSGSSPREVLSFSVRQTVALSDPFERFQNSGPKSRFTPVTASLHVNPYASTTLDANATFGSESRALEQASLSANLRGMSSHFALTWFGTFAQPDSFVTDASQYRVSAGVPIIKDRLRAAFQINYDAKLTEILEQQYMVGFKGSCWGVDFAVRDLVDNFSRFSGGGDPGDRILNYEVAISLKNVGTFGPFDVPLGRRTRDEGGF